MFLLVLGLSFGGVGADTVSVGSGFQGDDRRRETAERCT